MTTLRFEILSPNAAWVADGEEFSANDNELFASDGVEATDALVRLAHHAHAAGVIRIDHEDGEEAVAEAVSEHGVQSQEDGEAALAEAMGEWIPIERDEEGQVVAGTGQWSGPWHEGNLLAFAEGGSRHGQAPLAIDTEGIEIGPGDVARARAVLGGEV